MNDALTLAVLLLFTMLVGLVLGTVFGPLIDPPPPCPVVETVRTVVRVDTVRVETRSPDVRPTPCLPRSAALRLPEGLRCGINTQAED